MRHNIQGSRGKNTSQKRWKVDDKQAWLLLSTPAGQQQ